MILRTTLSTQSILHQTRRAESEGNNVKGLIVQHRVYGYGKILAVSQRRLSVEFCETGQTATFTFEAFSRGDLTHAKLNIDDRVLGPDGPCVITHVPSPGMPNSSHFSYTVRYENGLTDTVSEIALKPLSFV